MFVSSAARRAALRLHPLTAAVCAVGMGLLLPACGGGGGGGTSDTDGGVGGSTGGTQTPDASTGGSAAGGTGGSGGTGGGNTGGTGGGNTGGTGGNTGGTGGTGGSALEPDAGTQPPGACGAAPVVEFATDVTTEDDGSLSNVGTTGDASALDGSCVNGSGSEVVFHFVADTAGTWRFLTQAQTSGLDTILYARTSCTDTATELDCNDDLNYPDNVNSRIVADLEAGQELFVVADAYPSQNGPQSGDILLNAKRVDRIDRDGACDGLGIDNVCRTGDFCYVPADSDGAGVCTENTPPTMTGGQVFLIGNQATFTIAGTDASQDTQGIHILYLQGGQPLQDAQGGDAETYLGPITGGDPYGLADFTFRTAQDFVADLGIDVPDQVAVSLFDSQGNESDPQTLDLLAAPAVALDGACDQYRLVDDCADGTACRQTPDADPVTWTCQTITAPTLTAAQAWMNGDTGHLEIAFDGVDPDRDIYAPGVVLLDADGADIPLLATGDVGEALGTFEPFTYGDGGGFHAVWEYVLVDNNGLSIPVSTARVRIHDSEGLISDSLDVMVGGTERNLAAGSPCDPWGAQNTCARGTVCPMPVADDPMPVAPVCSDIVAECPADYEAVNLNDGHGADPTWTVSGDTTDSGTHGGGTCGGGAGDKVFTFTAPSEGTYHVATAAFDGGDIDTVLYARSACQYGPEYAGFELGCNDDENTDGGIYSSVLDLDLTAQETVYLFVDGYVGQSGAWQGPFNLTVTRP